MWRGSQRAAARRTDACRPSSRNHALEPQQRRGTPVARARGSPGARLPVPPALRPRVFTAPSLRLFRWAPRPSRLVPCRSWLQPSLEGSRGSRAAGVGRGGRFLGSCRRAPCLHAARAAPGSLRRAGGQAPEIRWRYGHCGRRGLAIWAPLEAQSGQRRTSSQQPRAGRRCAQEASPRPWLAAGTAPQPYPHRCRLASSGAAAGRWPLQQAAASGGRTCRPGRPRRPRRACARTCTRQRCARGVRRPSKSTWHRRSMGGGSRPAAFSELLECGRRRRRPPQCSQPGAADAAARAAPVGAQPRAYRRASALHRCFQHQPSAAVTPGLRHRHNSVASPSRRAHTRQAAPSHDAPGRRQRRGPGGLARPSDRASLRLPASLRPAAGRGRASSRLPAAACGCRACPAARCRCLLIMRAARAPTAATATSTPTTAPAMTPADGPPLLVLEVLRGALLEGAGGGEDARSRSPWRRGGCTPTGGGLVAVGGEGAEGLGLGATAPAAKGLPA
jgi:hypothetical protein